MSPLPRFRSQAVDTGSLLPLIADFSGVRSVAADKLKAARRQMGYQLFYELKSLEGLGSALVEPLGGCGPNNRVGSLVVLDFLGTGGTADHILAKSLSVFLAEKPGFAFDAESRMLPRPEHVGTGLVDQLLSQKQCQHRFLPDSEHALVGTDRQVDEAVVVGKPAFQDQDVPMGVESGKLSE